MTTVPCPRCGMLMQLDEVICAHCRTPRDDMEMEEGLALVRKEELRLKRRPKLITVGVAAAVLLASAWLLRGRIADSLTSAWQDFAAEVEKTREPSHWKKNADPEPLAASSSKPEVAVSSFIYLNTNAPTPQAAAEPLPEPPPSPVVTTPPLVIAAASDPPPPPWPGEVRVHGLVYDLATKLPVQNVKVQFQQKQGSAKWETTTDAAGRYQVGIFKSGAEVVTVMIEASGYRKGLLEDQDPPYRDRSPQSRTDLISETVDSDLEPVPLRHRESAQIVELDLVLVPEAKK